MSENETAKIRVAVVDDHEMFRAGVIATLRDSFDIVGQAADVPGSVAMIAQTKPQVVLLDVHVPGGEGGGGAEILAKSRPYSPTTVFLALSVSDAPQDVGSVIRAGVQGYVTKTITGADLISSIKQVHEGYAVFSPKLAGFVLSAFQGVPAAGSDGGADGAARAHDEELDRLSAREQEVMRLIARGYTYKEVAAELFISIKTVGARCCESFSFRIAPSSPAGPPIGALCDKRQMSSPIRGSSSAHITRRRGNRWGSWSAS